MKNQKYTSVDLFCGAGGLTEGFRQQGFDALFANDHEKPALETFRLNHPEPISSDCDIEKLDAKRIRKDLDMEKGDLDVLLGGPPCQGFSTYGKRSPCDARNQLYLHYIRFLDEFRPKTFVIENVVGILSIEKGKVLEDLLSRTKRLGYSVRYAILDSVNFGVPQYRKRVIILGAAGQEAPSYPEPTHFEQKSGATLLFPCEVMRNAITVREAISDLPVIALPPKRTQESVPYPTDVTLSEFQQRMRGSSVSISHHSAKQMLGIRRLRLALMRPGDYGTKIRSRIREDGLSPELIEELLSGGGLRDLNKCRTEDREKEQELRRILQEGRIEIDDVLNRLDSGGFSNKYRRLKWEKPSHTLVAHMARDCSDFVHPEIDRFVTVREAARLQSFPDTYRFVGSQFQQFRQIGNAVPPMLAQAVARSIREYLVTSSRELVA